MNPRELSHHTASLEWRFREADGAMARFPSSVEVLRAHCERGGPTHSGEMGVNVTQRQVDAVDRARRIDRVLECMPQRSVRVLHRAFGEGRWPPAMATVLSSAAGVALMTDAAADACARTTDTLRSRGPAVQRWLEALCERVRQRKASIEDGLMLSAIRVEADRLLLRALAAYNAEASASKKARRVWVS